MEFKFAKFGCQAVKSWISLSLVNQRTLLGNPEKSLGLQLLAGAYFLGLSYITRGSNKK